MDDYRQSDEFTSEIAFRQSHLTYRDPESNRLIKMNVYLYKGRVYHA